MIWCSSFRRPLRSPFFITCWSSIFMIYRTYSCIDLGYFYTEFACGSRESEHLCLLRVNHLCIAFFMLASELCEDESITLRTLHTSGLFSLSGNSLLNAHIVLY